MYDSINGFDIPTNAQMVAGYLDGSYAWSASEWNRFPNAVKVKIAVSRYIPGAHVYDVETGDFTPAQCCDVITIARSKGENPSAYVNLSNWSRVIAEFQARGLAQPPYWVAWYNGVATIPAGAVAKQYINPPGSGGHYDLSIVADVWPGIDGVYGPGGGTIGGGFGTLTDEEIQSRFVAVLDAIKGNREATNDLNGALFYPTTDPNYGKFAQLFEDKVRAIVKAELDKLPSSGGTAPTNLTGTITGKLT